MLRAQVDSLSMAAERNLETIGTLRRRLDELTRGRLPKPLQEITFDETLPVEGEGVHSIIFTKVGTADKPGYEYRLKVTNARSDRFVPRLRILVFNGLGVQVGSADAADREGSARLSGLGLGPGETAVYTGTLTLQFRDEPRYFVVLPYDVQTGVARIDLQP